MSDPTIFGENQNPATQPNQQPVNSNNGNAQPSQLDTMLDMIKNERGERKYRDVTEALNALAHSQSYIPTLKQELEATRSQLTVAQQEAAKIAELERTVQQLTQPNNQQNNNSGGFDEEQIAELVTRTLTKNQADAVRKSNVASVVAKLQETFGAEAEAKYLAKAQELGMSIQEINELAAKSPGAVFNLLGVTAPTPTRQNVNVNTSSINTSAITPPANTLITKNAKTVLLGATTQDVRAESRNAAQMVEELHAQGRSVHELTDPKVFFKVFT